MPRRREVPKRKVNADPKYQDRVVTKFINVCMYEGKKSAAEGVVYKAFALVEDRSKEEALKVFKRALDAIKPAVEVKSRRVGGANFQVPVEVRPDRRVALGLRWLRDAARERGERTMMDRRPWRRGQEARRHAPHGGSEQGVQPLPLVSA
jgi:small subunit ribosomal protein S7